MDVSFPFNQEQFFPSPNYAFVSFIWRIEYTNQTACQCVLENMGYRGYPAL